MSNSNFLTHRIISWNFKLLFAPPQQEITRSRKLNLMFIAKNIPNKPTSTASSHWSPDDIVPDSKESSFYTFALVKRSLPRHAPTFWKRRQKGRSRTDKKKKSFASHVASFLFHEFSLSGFPGSSSSRKKREKGRGKKRRHVRPVFRRIFTSSLSDTAN